MKKNLFPKNEKVQIFTHLVNFFDRFINFQLSSAFLEIQKYFVCFWKKIRNSSFFSVEFEKIYIFWKKRLHLSKNIKFCRKKTFVDIKK